MNAVSVVIPALNEEDEIQATISSLRQSLDQAQVQNEIIVVDDGSTDETRERAQKAGAKVIGHPRRVGYGRAIKSGIESAQFDLIAITDADGTYPNKRLPELLKEFDHGYDMVVGARQGKAYQGSIIKSFARWVFIWLSEYATGEKIPDINSGFRVFRKEIAIRYWKTISNGFSFTTTITLASFLNGHFIKYVPIDYYDRTGKSKVRYFRDSLRSLQIIITAILLYNPLKLFLLLSFKIAALGAICLGFSLACPESRLSVFLQVFAALTLAMSLLVGALGLTTASLRYLDLKKD